MQVGGPFYLLGNGGSSQNSGDDLVGALDYGRDNAAARDCPGSGALRGGATWACGVFGKMPRRRQGMHQSLYVEISNQGLIWSDATRACIRACRIQNAANEVILGCVSGCLDRMVR